MKCEKKQRYYPWLMCIGGMFCIFISTGFVNNLFSIYLPYIQNNGITSSQGSLLFSIRSASSLVGLLVVDKVYKKLSLRTGLTLGLLCDLTSALLNTVGENVWFYIFGAVFSGLGFCFAGIVPVTMLINRWFSTRRGFALGISALGSGVATIVFPPVITFFAEKYGLRGAFLLQVCVILFCLISVFLIVRNQPEEVGLQPYNKGQTEERKKTTGQNTFCKSDWLITIPFLLFFGGGIGSALGHLSVLYTSTDYSSAFSALMMSLFGMFQTGGKLIFGHCADKFGAKRCSIIWMGFIVLGLSSSMFFDGKAFLPAILLVVLFGLGFAPCMSGISLWCNDLATGPNYTRVMKWMQVLYSCGTVLFSSIPGRIYNKTGEYITSYIGMTIFVVMATCGLFLLYQANEKRRS